MRPEEVMAARILKRHRLKPPYDLDELVSNYGDLQYCEFPFSADGVTVGIDGKHKPSVMINESISRARQRFTLAHELGHIIIPWHIGTFVSHLDADDEYEYGIMEGEANRFAAELLLPSDWLAEKFSEYEVEDFDEFLADVIADSKASRDAAFIKIFKTLDAPIICAQVENSEVVRYYKTSTAPYPPFAVGEKIYQHDYFSSPHKAVEFSHRGNDYWIWIFETVSVQEVDPRTWREVLVQILAEVGDSRLLLSTNATMAAAYQKFKGLDEDGVCSGVFRAFESKDALRGVASHPLFGQYVIKRVRELRERG
ncbi:ImmA/IrrE family metallo-endopeptidase [Pseudomonas sp. 2hn]|uniref:ImmA/IrrE family metallo-endopeptidase n=1 Tax=Pseudomonas sp. 2hn TaxID=2866626 RepID=UPI001C7D279B|nr:ImmA/IrrE family metallo-endopeptidase [Pseudomonas sp. 2hn]QZA52582.1 ImmA/IrrE family metallo-endopeptidase [Pseudomonas sp. 2hn]